MKTSVYENTFLHITSRYICITRKFNENIQIIHLKPLRLSKVSLEIYTTAKKQQRRDSNDNIRIVKLAMQLNISNCFDFQFETSHSDAICHCLRLYMCSGSLEVKGEEPDILHPYNRTFPQRIDKTERSESPAYLQLSNSDCRIDEETQLPILVDLSQINDSPTPSYKSKKTVDTTCKQVKHGNENNTPPPPVPPRHIKPTTRPTRRSPPPIPVPDDVSNKGSSDDSVPKFHRGGRIYMYNNVMPSSGTVDCSRYENIVLHEKGLDCRDLSDSTDRLGNDVTMQV